MLTKKQYQQMRVIVDGVPDYYGIHEAPDMDKLLEHLSYKTTKESMQFSIRALIKHGLIEKKMEVRRGRKRVVFYPTEYGQSVMKGQGQDVPQSYVESETSHSAEVFPDLNFY